MNQVVLVLAGGAGERLWPLSTTQKPKPFVDVMTLYRGGANTMLSDLLRRIGKLKSHARYIATTTGLAGYATQANLHSSWGGELIEEPSSRGTGSIVARAISIIGREHGFDSNILLLPSDVHFGDDALLSIKQGPLLSSRGDSLVMFGTDPLWLSTEHGYIQTERSILPYPRVVGFREKPGIELAAHLIASGAKWNSGCYAFRCDFLSSAIRRHAPVLASVMDDPELDIDVGGLSFDHSIVERMVASTAARDIVRMVDGGRFSIDLGTWEGLARTREPDDSGNVSLGNVTFSGSSDCIGFKDAHGEVRIEGCSRMVVVSVKEKVLIRPRADTAPAPQPGSEGEILSALERCEYAPLSELSRRFNIPLFRLRHLQSRGKFAGAKYAGMTWARVSDVEQFIPKKRRRVLGVPGRVPADRDAV